MMLGRVARLGPALLVAWGSALSVIAVTAANSVPATRMGTSARTIDADALKPAGCAAIALATLVTGSGIVTGTAGADLILTGTGIDAPNGADGNDCIVAGDGNDSISGGNGNDVLYGGPGADTINGGAGTDVCYGGDGIDVFVSCETQVQ